LHPKIILQLELAVPCTFISELNFADQEPNRSVTLSNKAGMQFSRHQHHDFEIHVASACYQQLNPDLKNASALYS
jgi:hypothetical protein